MPAFEKKSEKLLWVIPSISIRSSHILYSQPMPRLREYCKTSIASLTVRRCSEGDILESSNGRLIRGNTPRLEA